jgi:glycosyltransferase involved in cell wall biosynthesis
MRVSSNELQPSRAHAKLMNASISVIVTHHDRPDVISDAMESVLKQTLRPLEIILVDDCSTPENRAKLNEFAGLATIVDTPANLGSGGSRNFGARFANGDWLCFLDDDDLYMPDKLERQVRYLEMHPSVEALGGALIMESADGAREHWGATDTGKIRLADALNYTASMSQALMIKRDLFRDLGGFTPVRHCMDDREFGIRLVASGREVHFLGEPLFLYRIDTRFKRFKWKQMLSGELTALKMHGELVRHEFGRLGPVRLRARCYKKYGLRRGGAVGRSVWAFGSILEAIFGREAGKYR